MKISTTWNFQVVKIDFAPWKNYVIEETLVLENENVIDRVSVHKRPKTDEWMIPFVTEKNVLFKLNNVWHLTTREDLGQVFS